MPSNLGIIASGIDPTTFPPLGGPIGGAPGLMKWRDFNTSVATNVSPFISEPGDLYILVITTNPSATTTIDTPSGWTRIGSDIVGATGPQGPDQTVPRMAIFTKQGDGTAVSVTPTVTATGATPDIVGSLYHIRGGGGIWAVDVSPGVRNTDTTNPWIATGTAALEFTVDDLVIWAFACDTDSAFLSRCTMSTASGHSWYKLQCGSAGSATGDSSQQYSSSTGDDQGYRGFVHQCIAQPVTNPPINPVASVTPLAGVTSGPYAFIRIRSIGDGRLYPFVRCMSVAALVSGTWRRRVSGSMSVGDKQLHIHGGRFGAITFPAMTAAFTPSLEIGSTGGSDGAAVGNSRTKTWERDITSPLTGYVQEGTTTSGIDVNGHQTLTIGKPAGKTLSSPYAVAATDDDQSSTAVNMNFGSMTLQVGDFLVLGMTSPTTVLDTAMAFSGTGGITFGTLFELGAGGSGECDEGTTLGNDMRLYICTALVTAGGTGTVTYTATAPTAGASIRSGCLHVYRAT